ncbi:MAG: zinc-binding dehydrogenase [Sphingomonadaceae bacterium]|nr:zinc-binding dehydrogenase [Sphingomonadaceae bacterium]
MVEALPDLMAAAAFRRYGPPEQLERLSLPRPTPGPRQVLIEVAYATINPADLLFREGALAAVISGDPPYVAGLELAGRAVATGTGSRWRPGEPLAAITSFIPGGHGAHCRYVVVDDDSAAVVPAEVPLDRAAVIPMSGLTAQLAIDRIGALAGKSIAISGAAGAVGGFATELAVLAGAEVIAIVDPAYEERVRRLGATHVVARGADSAGEVRRIKPDGADALIDAAVVGTALLPAVKDGGRVMLVRDNVVSSERGIAVEHVSVGDYRHERSKLERLLWLAATGRLTPVVARLLPPERAAEGHRALAGGGLGGRIVLDFTGAR